MSDTHDELCKNDKVKSDRFKKIASKLWKGYLHVKITLEETKTTTMWYQQNFSFSYITLYI